MFHFVSLNWTKAAIRDIEAVNFIFNPSQRNHICTASNATQQGYASLEYIINNIVKPDENQVFVLCRYNDEQIITTFHSIIDIQYVLIASDYVIHIKSVKGTKAKPTPKLKVEAFVSHSHWISCSSRHKNLLFHV